VNIAELGFFEETGTSSNEHQRELFVFRVRLDRGRGDWERLPMTMLAPAHDYRFEGGFPTPETVAARV
jgi:hypothetical protein